MLNAMVYRAAKEHRAISVKMTGGDEITGFPVSISDEWLELFYPSFGEEWLIQIANISYVSPLRMDVESFTGSESREKTLYRMAPLVRAANTYLADYKEGPNGTL